MEKNENSFVFPDKTRALTARHDSSPCIDRGQNVVCYGVCSYASNSMKSSNPNSGIYEAETARTLDTSGRNPACNQGGVLIAERGEDMERKWIVRRLTPTECGRLQGFPDGWTDDVEGSDSARYRLWGNGIALPCAVDVLGRIAREMSREQSNSKEGVT